MIQFKNVTLSIGNKILYKNVNITLKPGVKYALLGANGAGKTSLFRLLTGELTPDNGTISIPSDVNIGYLPQDIITFASKTIWELINEARKDYFALLSQIEELEVKIQNEKNDIQLQKMLESLQKLYDQKNLFNPARFEANAEKILTGLGFQKEQFHLPLQSFSGGWQMRVYLAKLLLTEPDFLFLDEPTNHLDIQSFQWLEDFLQKFKGGVVFITHDKYFVDHLSDKILYIDSQNIEEYSSPYAKFEQELEEKYERKLAEYVNQQKRVKEIQRFIDRFRYKASKAKQVQSRLKDLKKIKKVELPELKTETINISFSFSEHSYKQVFHISDIWYAYEKENWVIQGFSADIFRGEKIGIIGPNGAGKTTLLKILAGLFIPLKGSLKLGKRVHLGYYAQHQIEQLNLEHSILDEIYAVATPENRIRVRNILGAFLFHDEEQEKKIKVLSGGEKARVALAKLLVQPYNTLLLDEPTNHLDISSKEVLVDALKRFPGTILVVSHDREFLDALVEKMFFISGDHSISEFHGNFSDFYQKNRSLFENYNPIQSQAVQVTNDSEKNNSGKDRYTLRKELKREQEKLLKKIMQLEKELEHLNSRKKVVEQHLSNPLSLNPLDLNKLSKEHQDINRNITQFEEQWLNLMHAVEEIKEKIRALN